MRSFIPSSCDQKLVFDRLNCKICIGDKIGLIGKNGSGKTTFLRLASGIYQPTSGEIERNVPRSGFWGRGIEFFPNATIEQNIRLSYLCSKKSQCFEVYKNMILDFAEINQPAETPIYQLSDGNKARLKLSITTVESPSVIIMDEWLGTGDKMFQKKAADKLNSLIGDSKCLIFASHNESLMKSICNRIMVVRDGGLYDE